MRYIDAPTRKQAKEQAPWAAKLVKVEAGFLAFHTITEYTTWKNQK